MSILRAEIGFEIAITRWCWLCEAVCDMHHLHICKRAVLTVHAAQYRIDKGAEICSCVSSSIPARLMVTRYDASPP